MKKIIKYLKDNIVTVLVSAVSTLLVINIAFMYQNKETIERNNIVKVNAEDMIKDVGMLTNFLKDVDLGVRAYGITKNQDMLGPAKTSEHYFFTHIKDIEERLAGEGYDISGLEDVSNLFRGYLDFSHKMVEQVDLDSMNTFKSMMAEDRGLAVWKRMMDVVLQVMDYEKEKSKGAEESYNAAVRNNLYLELFIIVLALPTLAFIVIKIKRDNQGRQKLLAELEANNRKYIFNPGAEVQFNNQQAMIEHSILNLQQASEFIEHISDGDYEAEWKGLNEENKVVNETNLAGRLTRMRDQLKHMKHEEEARLWSNEGLTRISEIVRNNQNDFTVLSNEVIRFLTKYMDAQQGGLFVLKNDANDKYLELAACHAYDRKKFVERKIPLGVGLLGQTFLEGETTMLTKLPQGYTYITSGMGEATPGCLLIVPMKYNDITEAVVEIAGLDVFDKHQIAFMEKAGEFVASALQGARTTEEMKHLLETSQRQAADMRATEEELRQNVEELMATREALERKLSEAA
ncbi:GAF domain-containing protein [Ohtaekwangia sp.]|uniref:GAF domain-containing protein n=1 Tax=Ohtaekwangia sp. TaxID=2066019 RepID=UPI002FDCB755